ncbi:PAS domain S-box protein [Candidatus Poribacteria bacterium]|nr:PAS domain S-box protein [Candidatus Poribacteria bacterium]MBT5712330.1 PAS domain S-box protein [Candidatus Poribacteria bacterium]MBT7805008.1 PAS domain S-box protein [Candidatus Poribacteria bacterium]
MFFAHSPVGLALVGSDGRFVEVNLAIQQMLGYSEEQLREMSIVDVTHADDVDSSVAMAGTLVDGAQDRCRFEKRYVRRDGEIVWAAVDIAADRLDDGSVRFLSVVEDITERRSMEDALREGERRFRAIYDASPIGIAVASAAGDLIHANPAFARMLQRSEAELLGLPIREYTHPDDADGNARLFAELVDGKRDQYRTVKRYVRADGTVVVGDRVATALRDNSGRFVQTFAMVEDITDRLSAERSLRESENEKAAILSAMPDLVLHQDADGRYLNCYKAPEIDTLIPVDAFLGKFMEEVLPPDLAASGRQLIDRALRTQTVQTDQYQIEGEGDGSFYDLRMAPVGADEVVSVIRDVTSHRRAEALLAARARQQAVAAQFGQEALAGRDLPSLLQRACEVLVDTLDATHAKVLRLMPDGENLRLEAGIGWSSGLVGHAAVDAGPESQAGFTLLSDSPVVVQNLREEARFRGPQLLLDHRVVSGLSVVVRGVEGPYGVLGAHTSRHREFRAEDVDFIESIANVLASAIVRAAHEEAIQDLNVRLEARVAERTRALDEAYQQLQSELTVRERAEQNLRTTQDERSRLMQRILTIQEEEHTHIARELHDRAGQGLSSLLLGMRALERKLSSDSLGHDVAQLRELTTETLASIRNLALEMRPSSLEHLGLAATLEQDVLRLGEQLGVKVGFHGHDPTGGRLPPAVEIALYRAAHAALTNVKLHAKASSVSVTMQQRGDRLTVIVEDDGVGFDIDATLAQPVDGRFGLLAMTERLRPFSGEVAFEASPGQGTTVFLDVPIAPA